MTARTQAQRDAERAKHWKRHVVEGDNSGECCCADEWPCLVILALDDADALEEQCRIHVLRADSLRAELRRLEEELELDGRDAVSEAVERIVEAVEGEPEHGWMLGIGERTTIKEEVMLKRRVIEIVRSRDWSKGEG